jgi:hypothetical protein
MEPWVYGQQSFKQISEKTFWGYFICFKKRKKFNKIRKPATIIEI